MSVEALPEGIVTPLVCFQRASGEPDSGAVAALVESQIVNGVRGVLVNGSMGESSCLTLKQRGQMLEEVLQHAAGRVSVWAGIIGLGTLESRQAAVEAANAGAHALLVLPPLFFDYSDVEIHRHFELIKEAVDLPILAYDVAPRTPRKMPAPLVSAMARSGAIQGIKDSSQDLGNIYNLRRSTADLPGFKRYLGSEFGISTADSLGFVGTVPGLANIAPSLAVSIDEAARRGDDQSAEAQQARFDRLSELLSIELSGASASAVAFATFKAATAAVLGVRNTQTSAPFVQPDLRLLEAVAELERSMLTDED